MSEAQEQQPTSPMDGIKNELDDFFSNEIPDKIDDFVQSNRTTFKIDLQHLSRFKPEFVDTVVIDQPDLFLEACKDLLEGMVLGFRDYTDPSNVDITVRVKNVPERYLTGIRDIRTDDRNKFVFIRGRVSKSTDVQPKIAIAKYECPDCGGINKRKVPNEELQAPRILDCKNVRNDGHSTSSKEMDLVMEQSILEDFQRLRVQESPDEISGDNPKNIDVNLTGDELAGEVHAGQKITASGVLRVTQPDDNSAILNRHIEGINVEPEEVKNEDIDITEDEVKQIIELSEKPLAELMEMLGQSIDPKIEGYSVERQGLVLALFSGVPKEFKSSGDIRGNIHVLLVGDPGTGKSGLLRYTSELSPTGGIFTSGKGTSSAGLTAAAVRDQEFGGNDKWTLKAGALVLADEGVACVDELDKMSDTDRDSLHEALEQQEISISKAGITATLNSRCTAIGAANPKHGRFNSMETLAEQIELDPALYSRFDLIFTIEDKIDENRDERIANSILDNNLVGQQNAQLENELVNNQEENEREISDQELEEKRSDVDVPVPKDLFTKYIAYAQENYSPELSSSASQKIKDTYLQIRQKGSNEDSPVPETARALEALVRLSEAVARVKLSNTIEIEHAEHAIKIYRASKEQTGVDPETGEWDSGIQESGTTKSQSDRIDLVKQTVKEFNDTDDEIGASKDDVISHIVDNYNISETKLEAEIDKMLSSGREIYGPKNGRLKLS